MGSLSGTFNLQDAQKVFTHFASVMLAAAVTAGLAAAAGYVTPGNFGFYTPFIASIVSTLTYTASRYFGNNVTPPAPTGTN